VPPSGHRAYADACRRESGRRRRSRSPSFLCSPARDSFAVGSRSRTFAALVDPIRVPAQDVDPGRALAGERLELELRVAHVDDEVEPVQRPVRAPLLRPLRVAPVLEELAGAVPVRLSIDTYKPSVAEACLGLGATLVNDITGFEDPEMARVTAAHGAGAVVMHMRGRPKTMQQDVAYEDVVSEVRAFLAERADRAREAGIEEVIVDPGIGFGKTAAHNFELLKRLDEIVSLGYPVLVGASRKSFLGSLPSALPPEERLEGTLAAVAVAVMKGASIVRVHDVRETKRVVEVVDAVLRA